MSLGAGVLPGCVGGRVVERVPPPPGPAPTRPAWPPAEDYPAPDLADRRVLRQLTGVRPYRRGSVRVELETVRDKPVVHQYGHGGAGITLAPATAHDAIDLLASAGVAPPQTVAVLGAGVVGMTTADLLLERGYRAVLYTEHVTPNTTSDVAGGQFAPATVAVDRADRLNRWMRLASDYYLPRAGRSCGVDHVVNFTDGVAGGALRRLPDARFRHATIERLPITGVRQPGQAYETLIVAPPIYLPWLAQRLQQGGARLRFRRFESREQVAALPEAAVMNCLGLGAKTVFDDDDLIPIRGRLVLLDPQPLGYLLSHRRGYLFSRSDALILGGTYDRGQTDTSPDPRVTGELLDRHRRFFLQI
ncbi:MAG: FAD-dependent oxidoreductase [Phycisphaeraceae bacterium]